VILTRKNNSLTQLCNRKVHNPKFLSYCDIAESLLGHFHSFMYIHILMELEFDLWLMGSWRLPENHHWLSSTLRNSTQHMYNRFKGWPSNFYFIKR